MSTGITNYQSGHVSLALLLSLDLIHDPQFIAPLINIFRLDQQL
jgi:hypothetical protein